MAFRFIHTADLHLDSPLKTLALRDPDLGATIANATRRAFVTIVDACLTEAVDALLIAGDLYDGEIRSMATPLFLGAQLRRLHEAGIPTFMIRGNHDAVAAVTRHLSLPDTVHVFGAQGGCMELAGGRVAVHGVSFQKKEAPESLLPKFGSPVEGAFNIGLLHTSLAGAEGHDTYAPCSVADLVRHGFDYWALGHVHKRCVHAQHPTVVMPGMPQGRDINEAGPKSATLVHIGDDGRVLMSEIATAEAEFCRLEIDVSTANTPDDLASMLREAMSAARARTSIGTLVVRPVCVGRTGLFAWMRADAERLAAEAAQAADWVGKVVIDTVDNRARPLHVAPETKSADPMAELQALLQAEASAALMETAEQIIRDMRKILPRELGEQILGDESSFDVLARDLIRDGGEEVLARMSQRSEP